ncbi:MAG: hypothetical protein PF541_08670 [Prolixibacteraceae bacterium]|jgi:hypothetical protein|nr:hypothetical protein [Prolixibacteraceae bacterium]
MKTFIVKILIGLFFILASCSDDDFAPKPNWLSDKVKEIIEEDMCNISTVTVYQFQDEYYYNIYCGVWSCLFCHLYDTDGNAVNWDSETFTLFHENSEEIEEFPACE